MVRRDEVGQVRGRRRSSVGLGEVRPVHLLGAWRGGAGGGEDGGGGRRGQEVVLGQAAQAGGAAVQRRGLLVRTVSKAVGGACSSQPFSSWVARLGRHPQRKHLLLVAAVIGHLLVVLRGRSCVCGRGLNSLQPIDCELLEGVGEPPVLRRAGRGRAVLGGKRVVIERVVQEEREEGVAGAEGMRRRVAL